MQGEQTMELDEYARRFAAVCSRVIIAGPRRPDGEAEEELASLLDGVSPLLHGDLLRALRWPPSLCAKCGAPYRSYTGRETCWDCESEAKREKEREQMRKELRAELAAEAANGGGK